MRRRVAVGLASVLLVGLLAGCSVREATYTGAAGPSVAVAGDFFTRDAAADLHAALDPTYATRLFGEPDATLGDFTASIDGGEALADQLADPAPDVLVVQLGTNDAIRGVPTSDSLAALDALIGRFPGACVVGLTVTELGDPAGYHRDLAGALNAGIRARVDQVLDVARGVEQDPSVLEADGIHLDPSIWAPLAAAIADTVGHCMAAPPEPSVGLLGDSIVSGASADLFTALSPDHPDLRISAVPGATIADMLPEAERMATDPPDIVVVDLGTNDAWQGRPASQSAAELTAMTGLFPEACLVLVTVTEVATEPGYDLAAAASLNAAIRSRAGATVVDWAVTVAGDPSLLGPDGIHPTPAGNAALAEAVRAAVATCGGTA